LGIFSWVKYCITTFLLPDAAFNVETREIILEPFSINVPMHCNKEVTQKGK